MAAVVLIVEDHDDVREMLRDALKMAGYEVREAADGLTALRRIDEDPPDVVVLDLMLPHVSGFGVMHDLAAQGLAKKIPVVVITGTTDPLDGIDAACVLRKPISSDRLVAEIERCLARARCRPS